MGTEIEKMPVDPREKAAYLIRGGKTDEALSIYRVLAAQNPRSTERLKELMWALWQAERYSETVAVATKLNKLLPTDIEVLNLLARARTMLGQKQAAIWDYEKSLAVNPEQLSVRLAIVRLRIELKDLETASAELIRLKARYPNEANIYASQAQVAFLQGFYEEALPLWTQAIALAPDIFLFKIHEIETLYHLGQMSKAHEKLQTIVAEAKEPWLEKDRRDLWALLETVPAIPGEEPEPRRPHMHPMGLDEVQIGLAIGRIYSDLRDYEAASGIFFDLEKTHKDNPEIYSRLARQYFLRGLYTEAAEAWASASKLSPDDVTFQFEQARSLYYAGERKMARTKLQDVALRQSNSKWRAIDFLTDVAIVDNDLGGAQEYLESNLSDLHRPDEPRYLRLARIYEERGEINKCLATLESFIAQNPRDGRSLMFKADVLVQHGRIVEAMEIYKQVLQLNPATVRAYFSLADAYNVLYTPREALATIMKALTIDPTDPYLLIWRARYLYDVGDIRGSTRLLQDFLKTAPQPVVPAVLYHGLISLEHDPLLAYSVHLSTGVFEDHMRAFVNAGYQPVTAEEMNDWVIGKKDLPVKKPILITFDDARLDAIRNADPILEKYHLKATMFAPLVNVDKNLPGYTSWDQLKSYQETGRWEMQLHGDLGHIRIPVDSEGRSGLYLLNRQWRGTEKRLETIDEWTRRIADDHASGKQKMLEHLGKIPVSYSFPEGDFGQLGLLSSPGAAEINLSEVAKAYGTSYHQDAFGINIRTRDPKRLTRMEPGKDMTGLDLVHGFAEKNPFTLARITLLRQATWQDNIHKALALLDELKKEPDLSPRTLLTQEAQIYYAARDMARAERLAGQALAFGDSTDLQTLRSAIDTEKRFIWNPSFVYQEDNRNRLNWVFHQTLSTWGLGRVRVILHHLRGFYQEQGTPDVDQNAVGAASVIRLGLFHSVDMRVLGQFLSGRSDQTTYTAAGGLRSQWTDQWVTGLEGGRSLYDSALALNEGIAERYGRVSVTWAQENAWEMKSKGTLSDLSDGNRLYDVEFSLTRQVFTESNFRAGYHFETEHMRDVRPEYYSPQHLLVHQAVFQWSTRVPPGFYFRARYYPGYGKEDTSQAEFINDFELALPIPLGKKTLLTPEIWLNRTPTYRRDSYGVSLTHRF
jgi:tetratricopeptide (TPR) repeat protein